MCWLTCSVGIKRSRSADALVRGFALVVCLLSTSACPGSLDDPARFLDGGSASCAVDVEVDILAARCGGTGCHEGEQSQRGLDLVSPGVTGRLIDVEAEGCVDEILVRSDDPGSSLLIDKLRASPRCGSAMPIGAQLSSAEIECVEQWVEEIVGGS
jgi:hypothetical protein